MRTAYGFGKQDASIVIGHLAYFIILATATYLTPRMAGLELNNIIDIWDISALPGVLAAVAVLAALAGSRSVPSVFFLHLTLLTLVTPSLVLIVSGGLPWSFAVTTILAFLVVAALPKFFSFPIFWNGFLTTTVLMWICITAIILYTASILMINGYQHINFSIWKVYEVRKVISDSLPRVFGYLTPIITGIFIPIAAVEAVRKNKIYLSIFIIALGVFIFGITSYKGIALTAIASIVFYWLAKQKKPIEYMIIFLIMGVVASTLETEIASVTGNMSGYDRGIFSSLFLRRFLLIPSILNWSYIDYFSGIGEFFRWSASRITFGLVHNPFGMPPPHLIGTEYFKDPALWANAGWIASGFANASYLGVLIYSIGFGIVLSVMDALGRKLEMPFVVGAMTLTVWKVATTTDFLTALLTHGLLVGLLLLMLVRGDSLERSFGSVRPVRDL